MKLVLAKANVIIILVFLSQTQKADIQDKHLKVHQLSNLQTSNTVLKTVISPSKANMHLKLNEKVVTSYELPFLLIRNITITLYQKKEKQSKMFHRFKMIQ